LVALAYSVVYGSGGFIDQQKQGQLANFQAILVLFMFIATLASLVLLYRARAKLWRAIFATLSGMGLIILGAQDGVYRLGNEWYWSHYYYGIVVSLLMIFSLAIVEDIYKDRANRWRNVHIILNCLALLLFIGQGITGARDLLEVPLSWQKPAVYGCNFQQKKCTKSAIPDRNNPSVALIKK
jgi:membrane protein YdbS with pleckstrin-like domain